VSDPIITRTKSQQNEQPAGNTLVQVDCWEVIKSIVNYTPSCRGTSAQRLAFSCRLSEYKLAV